MTENAEMFEGFVDRECGKHDSVGRRAWCSTCSEWCYPNSACKGCELPSLRVRVEQQAAENGELREQLDRWAETDGAAITEGIEAWKKATAERDEALRTVRDLTDDRDTAREVAAQLRSTVSAWRERAETAERTVGELREALDRYEDGVRCVLLGLTTPELFITEAAEALESKSASPPPTVEGEG